MWLRKPYGNVRSYMGGVINQRRNFMKYSKLAILLGIALVCAHVAYAQESEAKLVDEVIARVGTGVIMRSTFEAESKALLEHLKQQGLKGEELEKKFKEIQPQILDELINRQLLAQKAKELSINVEPQVNQQLLRLMKDQNCDTKECLEQKMRDVGLDYDEVKRNLTDTISQQAVLYNEVEYRIFREMTEKEQRELYEKYKSSPEFTEPAEISLSRIYISFGKDAEQALQRAKEVAAQCKGGVTDFAAMAQQYSEETIGKEGGKLQSAIRVDQLTPEIKALVEKAPVGTVTDPVKLENGYYIFRVDDRKEERVLPFEDESVKQRIVGALINQQKEKMIDEYLAKLREQSFIEIDPRYQFENAKVKSAQIKRVPYLDEKERKREKEREKKEREKEAKQAKEKKLEVPAKATANNKQ
jgi:parvulin-like peptidyl-prolyl isomerase